MPGKRARYAAAAIAVAALAVGMVGCGGEAPSRAETVGMEDSEPIDLAGRTFISAEVRGHQLVEDTSVTLSFEDDRISAMAGCNTFSGAATWEDGTLSVDEPLAATMMACSPELEEQDEWLTQLLTSSPELSLDGPTLTVGDDSTGLTLEEQT